MSTRFKPEQVVTPRRPLQGLDPGEYIFPGERAYVITVHAAQPERRHMADPYDGEWTTYRAEPERVRVRCPETYADLWADADDLIEVPT